MKRFIFFLLITFHFVSIIAQSEARAINGFTYEAISHWKKGDTARYKAIKTKKSTEDGIITINDSTTYNIDITVIHSTESSYFVQWHYKDYRIKRNGKIQSLPPLTENIKVIYRTDEMGSFEEIINWEDIKDFIASYLDNLISGLEDIDDPQVEFIRKTVDEYKSLTSNKDFIENLLTEDIQQFHIFYGNEYKLNSPQKAEVTAPNVLGSEPYTGQVSIVLDKIYSNGFYQLKSVQWIPPAQIRETFIEYFSELLEQYDKSPEYKNKILNQMRSFDFQNETEIIAILSPDGWVQKTESTKKIITHEGEAIQALKIELID